MNSTHESFKKNIWSVTCALAVLVGSLVTMSTAHATLTDKFSSAYVQECLDAGVPLPPVFGTTFNFWKYTGQLSASQVFVDNPQPTDIYYFISDSTNNGNTLPAVHTGVELKLDKPNPEGLCMLAIRKAAGTQTCGNEAGQNYSDSFQVICQGKNGNACFWNLKPGNTFPWAPGSALSLAEGRNLGRSPPPANRAIQPAYTFSHGTVGPQCYKTTQRPTGFRTTFDSPPFAVAQDAGRSFDTYIVQLNGSNESIDQRTDNTSLPAWVGGAHLVGNKEGICTACHSGENMFINHPGTATDINPLSPTRVTNGASLPHVPVDFYFPKTWPNPIVPSSDPLMGGQPWPQNPPPLEHYNAIHPANGCFSCHDKGKPGGRFPKISDLAALDNSNLTKNYCYNVLYPSITRTGSNNGAMPIGTASQAIDTDSFARSMWFNLCVGNTAPRSAENGLTAAVDRTRGRVHKSAFQSGFHEHSFTGRVMPSVGTAFLSRDKICVDGFVSSSVNLTPSQVAIQFLANDGQAGDTWNHRAYWGLNNIGPLHGWPASGSVGNFQANTKVAPKGRGYWNQYCVTAGSVGLTQKNISGIKFTLFDGAMWWGSVYYYRNGGGAPQTLFTTPLDLPRAAAGGDYWNVVNTPAYLFWNPAQWSAFTFGAGSEGSYGSDQFGNINLGLYKDNYCYMNTIAHRAGDEVALHVKSPGTSSAWWSLGASFNAPSQQSTIGANCIPWKELTTGTTRGKTTIPPTVDTGMFFGWQSTGNNGQQNPSPPPSIVGGSPSTNLCLVNGLKGAFSSTSWSDINLGGVGGSDGPTSWFWTNKTPQGLTMCGNIGIGTLFPKPASAFNRGKTTWYNLNQQWSGSGGSVDISALSGPGKDANNQFCYLVGFEPSSAIPSSASPGVSVVVADGTNFYTDKNGAVIPAGRWVVWAQSGMSWVKVGCQSTPI